MDERIQALLAALADEATRTEELAGLSDEQVGSVHAELEALFASIRAGEVEGVDASDIATLRSIGESIKALRTEAATRIDAAVVAEAEVAALVAELSADPGNGDDDESDDGEEDDEEEVPETPPVEVEVDVTVDAPEPVKAAARRPSLAQLAGTVPSIPPRPGEMVSRPRWQTLNGETLESMDSIAERIQEANAALVSAPAGFADKVVVARLQAKYPEEMTYTDRDDAVSGTRKAEALMAPGRSRDTWAAARQDPALAPIVASGGWCAPLQPIYDLFSVASQNRPVRASLPTMGVNRGGVSFVRAAPLSLIVSNAGAGSGVSVWTAATDETPGESVKPRQTMACRTIVERELSAILLRLRFGNFQGRAFPELVADDVALAMAAHARLAESTLLDSLIAQINIDVTETGLVGTARDLKIMLGQAAAQLEYVERSENAIRAIVAREALRMVVQDVTLQQASGEVDAVMVDQAWARSMLASSDVNLAYAMDHSTGPDAIIPNSDAGGQNLADYPDNLEIPVFFEGSVLFLDGGRLDLGIIRDSTLNNTNDYELFVETFEETAWLGPRGLTVTLTTCPNGESQVATDETGAICSGS